jgi:cysteine desulfurase/selenocysteine lyase
VFEHRPQGFHYLAEVPGVRVIGPAGLQGRIGVVSFEAAGAHSHDVCHLLGARGVCLRGGHDCAQPLMDRFSLVATACASLAPYNDAADIDALLEGLVEALAVLR